MHPVDLPAPRGVLFDCGGTLIREGEVDMRAGAERVLELASDTNGCDPDRLAAAFRSLIDDLGPRREASWLEPPPFAISRLVHAPLGIQFEIPLAEIEWAFCSASHNWTALPGITDILDELRRRSIPCGVVSNTMFTGETIARQMVEAGIPEVFRFVMASADYVVRKPHRRLFDIATARLGCSPRDVWFIGDSLEADVRGAAAAGMTGILYQPDGAQSREDLGCCCIESWAEFGGVLKRVLGRASAV